MRGVCRQSSGNVARGPYPWILCILLGLAIAVALGEAGADVQVSLQPAESCAGPEETFDVVIHVDQEGSGFDGYEAVILFDPGYLEVESLTESGMLIQGLCGTTWWYTEIGDSSIFISHVALCGGDSLTGPGPLSAVTFRATGPLGLTEIAFEYVEFYRIGSQIPCVWTDAIARIQQEPCVGACCFPDMSCELLAADECLTLDGEFLGYESTCDPNPCEFSHVDWPDGAGDAWDADGVEGAWDADGVEGAPGGAPGGPAYLVSHPNPMVRQAQIAFEVDRPGLVQLDILDTGGRLIRTLLRRSSLTGRHQLQWDGRDQSGQPAAPGAYFVRLAIDAQTASRRLVLLR